MKKSIIVFIMVASMLQAVPVLKTGQTKSYDVNGEVTDGSIKDDGYYQKGLPREYARAAGVVTDKTTGLEWQDEYEEYDIYGDLTVRIDSWQGAKDYCAALGLAGGDWRLPTKNELASLADYSRYYPSIDPIFTMVRKSDWFWTDTNTSDNDGVWNIHTGLNYHGATNTGGEKYVRCVRKGEVVKPSNFSRSGDIVTDSVTGLQWQDDSIGSTMTWENAIDHCEGLTLGGHENWRMPNIHELRSIVDYTSFRPSIDTNVFQNTTAYFNYFSSTQFQNGGDVFSISFDEGRQTHNGRNQSILVRCVRNTPFNFSYELDKIEHMVNSNTSVEILKTLKVNEISSSEQCELNPDMSNVFSVKLKNVKSLGDDLKKVCDNYVFKVLENGTERATGSCVQFEQAGDKLKIDFCIPDRGDRQAYFEDGQVMACRKKSVTDCMELDEITNFTVYGTLFDLKEHAFSFGNSKWNIAQRDNNIKNEIAKAGEVIEPYLWWINESDFWDSVGYVRSGMGIEIKQKSLGLCTGMALSSIAYFNKYDKESWGTNNIWYNEVVKHKSEDQRINYPKPFNKLPYKYEKNDIGALKKIMYYFVAQSQFHTTSTWVGKYATEGFLEDYSILDSSDLLNNFKNGDVSDLYIKITMANMRKKTGDIKTYFPGLFGGNLFGTGHDVVTTEYISYNGKKLWYIYDNNIPNIFLVYKAKNFIYYPDDSIAYRVTEVKPRIGIDSDYLNIYNERQSQKLMTEDIIENYYEYDFTTYNSVSIVGGNFISIVETDINTMIVPLPVTDIIVKNQVYASKSSIFKNKLYLPTEKSYQVTIKKDPTIPFMKLYIKNPDHNGTIELLNYNNLQIEENGQMVASFYVGKGNSDKAVKRVGVSDYQPDHQESFVMQTPSVRSPSLVTFPGAVQLNWINPEHSNFNEVTIVRKENEKPTDRNDGTVIYQGTNETYTDTSVLDDTRYYYAFYGVSSADVVSEAEYLSVDTSKFSIYGSVLDRGDNSGIGNISILLKDSNTSEIINMTYSDKIGRFSLSNLENRSYTVEFSHPYYNVDDNNVTVTVENESVELLKDATGQPALALSVSDALQIGETQNISWNGVNIGTDQVNVELYRESTDSWADIATNVVYSDHHVSWSVIAPEEINATIRVSLQSDTDVYVEKNVTIYRDTDNDGYPNSIDDFPNDPDEWLDTDSDGVGNNADLDDDNDGMSDEYEEYYGLDSIDPSDANEDTDGDSYSNLEEYLQGSNPTDPESTSNCRVQGQGDVCKIFIEGSYLSKPFLESPVCDEDGKRMNQGTNQCTLDGTKDLTTPAYLPSPTCDEGETLKQGVGCVTD